MKKWTLCTLLALFCFLTNTTLFAQTQQNYFIGKWDMSVKDLPQGDGHHPLLFEMAKDASGKKEMVGYLEKTAETEQIKLSSLELEGDKLTFIIEGQGHEVQVVLTKKDDNTATGTFYNGRFEVVATRKKP
ncbi:hypothetical protein [Runella sp.]|uniref:hypothetical protein n=1 Tax=Runella sp. TaxID=1960881 RepID=UPI003D10E1CB